MIQTHGRTIASLPSVSRYASRRLTATGLSSMLQDYKTVLSRIIQGNSRITHGKEKTNAACDDLVTYNRHIRWMNQTDIKHGTDERTSLYPTVHGPSSLHPIQQTYPHTARHTEFESAPTRHHPNNQVEISTHRPTALHQTLHIIIIRQRR